MIKHLSWAMWRYYKGYNEHKAIRFVRQNKNKNVRRVFLDFGAVDKWQFNYKTRIWELKDMCGVKVIYD